jgi:HEAT repeat protein
MQRFNAGQPRTLVVLVALLGMMAVATVGCEQPEWDNPDYISKQLREGDTTTRQIAIEKAQELPEEKRKNVAAALADAYLEGSAVESDAMEMLVQMRVPEAKEAYMTEVKENRAGYAGAAAEALGEAGVKEAIPDMISLYRETDDGELKNGVLRAFSHMPDPEMLPVLVETLELDVDNHPIALHSYACAIMGDIAQEQPQALDADAKNTLVRSVFLANAKRQTVGRECGLAVQQLGEPAVPILVKVFKGEHEGVNTLLMQYNQPPNYQFPKNHGQLVATVRMTALRAPDAVDLFAENIDEDKTPPEELTGNAKITWLQKEAQATDEMIMGLGDIGDEKAYDVLVKALTRELNDKWEPMLDPTVRLQLRQDAAKSLNRLGNRDALEPMMEMIEKGDIVNIEAVVAPDKMLQRFQFNWMVAKAYANLATGEQLEEYEKMAEATEEKELKEKYKSFIPAIEVAKECMAKGDEAAQAKCYGEKLGDKDNLIREKAAFELSRLPAEAAAPVINENLTTDFLDTRMLLTFAAYRAPSKEMIGTIDEILEDEANRGGPKYKMDHNRLRLLRAWLKNNT